ncbi:hypothetical protein GGTG_00417 [Gaeumannomyces tritici R3-111a-1]|uniref:Uncharacterized protein n=1 Tax=Gaeumannomyces tritici (strain R3-111a-1) TaxID=644352 RepID=J3NGM8_GAET3|nr:hypothetical protein GGTG_00417 [Gaeumannomyces tritici R3-111a-1]EJT80418.1 hypothetical protein GGTG_00417 [Gaeumannomyces tritici R3-111a-1]
MSGTARTEIRKGPPDEQRACPAKRPVLGRQAALHASTEGTAEEAIQTPVTGTERRLNIDRGMAAKSKPRRGAGEAPPASASLRVLGAIKLRRERTMHPNCSVMAQSLPREALMVVPQADQSRDGTSQYGPPTKGLAVLSSTRGCVGTSLGSPWRWEFSGRTQETRQEQQLDNSSSSSIQTQDGQDGPTNNCALTGQAADERGQGSSNENTTRRTARGADRSPRSPGR